MHRLVKDSTITLFSRGLFLIIALVENLIVSRGLGPARLGSYNIVALVLTTMSLVLLLGLNSANVYLGARHKDDLPVMAGNSIVAALILGLLGVFFIEFLTLIPAFQVYLDQNNVPIIWIQLVILILPLVQLESFLREILRGAGYFVRYNVAIVFGALASATGSFIMVLVLHRGLEGALIALVVSQIVTTIGVSWIVIHALKSPLRIEWRKFRQALSFGLRLHVGTLAQFLNYRLDIFLVGLLLTTTDVGLYATATLLAERVWEVPHSIRNVLMYQVSASGDKDSVLLTARVCRVTFPLVGLMCLVISFLSYPLFSLYGKSFLPAVPSFILLFPGIWTLSVGKMLAVHMSAIGRPNVATIGFLIALVSTLILDLLLIPIFGISGASIASSVAYTLSTIIFMIIFLRDTELGWTDLLILHKEDVIILRQAFSRVLHRRFPSAFRV